MAVKYVFVTGGVVSRSRKRNYGGITWQTSEGERISGDHAEV